MKKYISVFVTVALASCASPPPAVAVAPRPAPDHIPCKVVVPQTEKDMKIAIRKLRRQGFQVTVIKNGEKKIVAEGGDPFPFTLAQANVVKSGC